MKIKLLAALIPYFKVTAVALGVLAYSQGAEAKQETFSWLTDRTEEIQKNSSEIIGDEWLKAATTLRPEAVKHAQVIREGMVKANPFTGADQEEGAATFKTDEIYQNLLFVSYSLGESALKEMLEIASIDQSVALVMRGIPEGMDVWAGMAQIQRLAAEFDPVPNIVLDPTLFEKYQVTMVPTLVFVEQRQPREPDLTHEEMDKRFNPLNPDYEPPTLADSGSKVDVGNQSELKEIARVKGLSDPEWIKRQVKYGQIGDLGIKGPVLEIAERDLIEVMKERVMQVDWDEKKRQASKRYWSNQRFIHLPTNEKEEIRFVDASVTATRDIVGSDGQFIAHAGTTVNPLSSRPFTQAIIVFDPTDKKQLHWIRDALPAIEQSEEVKKVVYIATQLETDDGWDNYEALTDELDAHVFLLTPDIKERFELRSTPSVITANSTHFVIHELFKPNEAEGNNEQQPQ